MKRKLSLELINNSFDFYNKNLGNIFSNVDYENLSSKLQEIIEYDHIIKSKKLPYDLPKNTLYLIYYIGEYKKAYLHAQLDKKDKSKNTLESLGEGFENKKKEYEKGLEKVLDKSIDVDERMREFFKTLMLLLLKKDAYKKVSMFLLGLMYVNYPLIKAMFNNIHQYNPFMQMVLRALDYTREYFKYTNIAEDKILNSSFIVIYTLLVQNLNIDQKKAFLYSKKLVESFIDNKSERTDRYRNHLLAEQDIYYTGIYQGMPIFQWYVSKIHASYYKDEDIKKFKVILRVFFNKNNLGFETNFMSLSVLKLLNRKATVKDLEEIYTIGDNDNLIMKVLLSSHKQFASTPFSLLEHLPKPRQPFILWTISLFIGFFSKFAYLKTKFAKK